ncbi:MAG: PAS domain S-box protein [Arcobacter sp.]|uniref:HD domain-containing phosphohydrolase n=1 Tax=Arcobacter sp. TaxID=1872629 RepID=UPI002590BA7B|nr:HD domain-containing phosphohydrolase [Arcobacter sp.]MDD3008440.1 PAS domain S-box protein [Arcobacter sp.]
MKKNFLILTALFFTSSLIIFTYTSKKQSLTLDIYNSKALEIKKIFASEVAKKRGNTAALTYLISKDNTIIEALLKKDRTLINFKEELENIQHFSDNKNLWIQITDKDGFSFYRSWTNQVGDNAAAARLDISDMIKSPKEMITISTGRFDMTFKTMLPIYDKNKNFIGIIEMISKFNSIAQEFKNKQIEPLFVLHEDYTSRFIKPFTGLFIGKNYVANFNANKELMKKVENFGIQKFLQIKDYMIFKDYFVVKDEIKDIHGGDMGYFFFFIKKDDIDTSSISEMEVNFLFLIITLIIISILTFLFIFNRNYVKYLNSIVKKKTFKIHKQKEYLKSLLEIYDKNVIFSKTDLNGVIVHVSEAFCKISGYTKKELIGKNHNIIRHPDMPKETFKYLWDCLKKGEKVNLEVKNLKKDGGYYWVEAEFEPYYDLKGNHIGYSAVRRDITANKDIEDIQREIIFTIGTIGESRSKETGNHVKRVAEYSYLLAKLSGLSEEECELLKQASPMHDIGKVAIPDSILHKTDKLTKLELELMKTHAIKGYELLKSSDRPLLKMSSTIALEHHEKWNGEGYPTGLKEEEISIYGRITAICDVFDALGSDRCYKKAWIDEEIFAYLKNEKAKHFDPKLIDIFFENLDKFLNIREKYKDTF